VQRLILIPFFSSLPASQLESLSSRIEQVFPLRVERHAPAFDPELSYDATRGQYNSRSLLAELLRDERWLDCRVLGLTGLDLFIPVLTYVFGEAQLGGRAAIVSSHRLESARYGLPAAPQLLRERVCKEVLHELGHTYELLHCHDPACVMASSTTVDGIDLKSSQFCQECAMAAALR